MVRFSVLTPAYNAEATLARCIESVQRQTLEDYEHVIVDDGSTDATLRIARSAAEADPRIRVVAREHAGLNATRVAAMEAARGELFVRLDADDELLPDYLKLVDDVFVRYPGTTLVSTNGFQVMGDGTRVYYYTHPLFQEESSLTLNDMLDGVFFGTSTVMARSVFELTGGPRPEARSEDLDLWLRAMSLGAVHRHLPRPVFLYHQDPNSMSKDVRAVWDSHIEILEHLVASGLLDADEIRRARKLIGSYRVRKAIRWDAWGIPLRRRLRGGKR